ncbi:MAG TPA: gluconeogenesis factor YvcK family protein [Candidatus Eremiobacteraceae bacterium]|nr:gluconeogenesis factor YvcK family protein [Candidatus Eremiobacteraceae bacterium]
MLNDEKPTRLNRLLRWLSPGMKLKRWLLVSFLGGFLFLDGFGRLLNLQDFNLHVNESIDSLFAHKLSPWLLAGFFIVVGLALVYYGIRQWMRSIVAAVSPQDGQRLIEVIYERRQLNRGYRLVAIGGGTGLSTVLRGLKAYTSNLTAIVTVTDDGGSSGRLRAELGVLPPGDIRNCLVALADSESMMADLFQYRFNEGDGLSGHSFGNLFIAAMCGIAGDFDRAIKESSRVLAIKGRVLPSTLANVALEATLADRSVVKGETQISKSALPIKRLRLIPSHCHALPEALEAILGADMIVLGPGSLYTSIMPNLLVPGIAEAIERSKAMKLFICNIMTQPGETTGMAASDHVRAVLEATDRRLFEHALVNIEQPNRLLPLYERDGAFPVMPDLERVLSYGVTPVTGDFISESHSVRHDIKKLGQAIMEILVERAETRPLNSLLPSNQRRVPTPVKINLT